MKNISRKQHLNPLFAKVIVRIMLSMVTVLSFFSNAKAGGGNKSFTIFNAIHYKNTPDLTSMGLQPINLVYDYFLLNPATATQPTRLLSGDSIRKVANNCLNTSNVPVTLDIEAWSFDAQNLDTTIKWYLQSIDSFKKTNSISQLGFYGVVPSNIIYKWKKMRNDINQMNSWKQLNTQLKPIADRVDIFFPAFYTYDKDTTAWKEAVTATINEAKKYNAGKPIYGYLWPQFHVSTPLKYQFLEPEIWNFELETLYNLTDGVVIWTSNKDVNGNIINWDTTMPWWQVTQAFIQRHDLNNPNANRYLQTPGVTNTDAISCTVYPNPAKDVLTVSWNNDFTTQSQVSIALYNLNGQKLVDAQVPVSQGNIQLSITDVPSGIYSCIVYCGDKKIVSKVSVIK